MRKHGVIRIRPDVNDRVFGRHGGVEEGCLRRTSREKNNHHDMEIKSTLVSAAREIK